MLGFDHEDAELVVGVAALFLTILSLAAAGVVGVAALIHLWGALV